METTTRQTQRDQRAYTLARKYLLSLDHVTPEMLDRHLSPAVKGKRPETLAGIYKHLLASAQGATMAPNVIGGAIGGIGRLETLLCGFDPVAVVDKYADDWERVLDDIVAQLKPRGKVRQTKRGLWPRFCRTITSGAAFLTQFDAASDFYEWVDSFDQDVESRLSLIERLSDAIHGVGFALACDFIKELGYLNFCKPDVHLKKTFKALELSPTEGDHQVFKAIVRVASNVGVEPYDIDKLFWLIGSGNFYLDGIAVGRHRDKFIEYVQKANHQMSAIPSPKSIDIAQVILNASVFNFRRARVMEDRLLQAVIDFFDLLETQGIDYLLVGGVALLNYVEGRNTEDVDLIISVADMNALDELTILEQDRDFGRATFRDLRVDLLWTQNPLFDYVKRHCATTLDFRGRNIACSTVEGLLLLKFYALPYLYREANFDKVALYETDIAMLLERYPIDVEAIFTELEKHLHEGDIQSLRTIHREIEDRIRRFTNGL